MEFISSLEPTSLHELLEKRSHHVETEWPNHPFFRVLVKEGSIHCYDHVESSVNLDEINSVKNRRKESLEEENSNTINPCLMLYGLLYVVEMLIEKGLFAMDWSTLERRLRISTTIAPSESSPMIF